MRTIFSWLARIIFLILALFAVGCAPFDAVGTGVGMGLQNGTLLDLTGLEPGFQSYYQPVAMPQLQTHPMTSCMMQQDPIGTPWGTATLRMRCY